MTIACLNGEFLPLAEARVPVLDRGFLFGDGVYEVIPAYGGRPFLARAHIERLKRSLRETRIADTLSADQWSSLLTDLMAHNGATDQFIYVQVTRGVQPQRNHKFTGAEKPTILALCQPLLPHPPDLGEKGVSCITHADIRWQRCDIKAISLLANVLLGDQATRGGHNETLLIHDDMLSEGASSNVFVYDGHQLITPPATERILHGITRSLILELAAECGIPTAEQDIPAAQLSTAAEVMISSSTREVFPVTEIDAQPVADGRPGTAWRRLYDAYQTRKQEVAGA